MVKRVNITDDYQSYFSVSCDDGDLRLVGGKSESEGRLDICFSQRWGTINGDGWTPSDTQVACRQLGFEGAGKLVYYTVSNR